MPGLIFVNIYFYVKVTNGPACKNELFVLNHRKTFSIFFPIRNRGESISLRTAIRIKILKQKFNVIGINQKSVLWIHVGVQ